jgi:F0F1-type ATP synthase delta subunit
MKPERDFALETELRRVNTMSRTELVSFIKLLVDNNRRTYLVLEKFQSITEEQFQVINQLVSIKEELETKIVEIDPYHYNQPK